MTSVPNKVLGYLKITGPVDNTLIMGPRFGRLSKNRDEVLLEITKRDTKKIYYYDDPTAKYFMPEPCWRNKRLPATDCGRQIEVVCGEDTCVAVFETPNINADYNDGDITPSPPSPPRVTFTPPSQQCPDGTVLPVEYSNVPPDEYLSLCQGPDIPNFCPDGSVPDPDVGCGGGGSSSPECPEGYRKFGFNQGNPCHGNCCICGDVGHCIYIGHVLAGYDTKGCFDRRTDQNDPDSPELPQGEADWDDCPTNPDPFCECPICEEDLDCNNPVNCKKCNATRTQYESEFRVCCFKQILACYQPEENGDNYSGMRFVSEGGTEILLEANSANFQPVTLGNDLNFTDEELEACGCIETFDSGFGCPVPPSEGDFCDVPVDIKQGHCGKGYAFYPGLAYAADPVCPLGRVQIQQQVYPKLIFAWWRIGSVGGPNPGEEIGVLPVGEPPVGGPNLGGGHAGGNCPEQVACSNGCEDGLACKAYLLQNSPENIATPEQNTLGSGHEEDCEPAEIPF